MTYVVYLYILISIFEFIQSKDYIINNKKCKLADYKPFNTETYQFYKKHDYKPCTNLTLLSYLERIDDGVFLRLRKYAIKEYTNDSYEFCYCCYSYVRRMSAFKNKLPDIGLRYTPSIKITNLDEIVELQKGTIRIKCYDSKKLIYDNVHNAILPQFIQTNFESRTKTNVLIIAIDSMSIQNLQRTMPHTYEFIKNNDFFEFKGYNKIDSNTFPNMMAFLTGLNQNQVKKHCDLTSIGKLDECPIIWKDYEDAGYMTAYVEDWSAISTFTLKKTGFKYPPTTFYWNPYIQASEKCGVGNLDNLPICTGPESAAERIFNLIRDFTTNIPKQIKTFGLFWLNSISHGYLNGPTRWDDKMKELFSDLKRNGVFNESIVIFLSDHGLRFKPLIKTTAGYFEDRHPFNFISLPNTFKEKWPNKVNNMKDNQNKLTSNFDLYMTFQDILVLNGFNFTMNQSKGCPRCMSLFSKIPTERSCLEAGIKAIWCNCMGYFLTFRSRDGYAKPNFDIAIKGFSKSMKNKYNTSDYRLVKSRISEIVNGYRLLLLDIILHDNLTYIFIMKLRRNSNIGKVLTYYKY